MRQQAVKAVREGQSPADVAKAFGMNVRTIFNWLAKFAEGGQNALLAKPVPGASAKDQRGRNALDRPHDPGRDATAVQV